jgi:hypothetical protein
VNTIGQCVHPSSLHPSSTGHEPAANRQQAGRLPPTGSRHAGQSATEQKTAQPHRNETGAMGLSMNNALILPFSLVDLVAPR